MMILRMPTQVPIGAVWRREHTFYFAFSILLFAAVFLGFARSFFLRSWFPGFVSHIPPEPFFSIHGLFFTSWLALLIIQTFLITSNRVHIHRRLGFFGTGLAFVMVLLGIYAGLLGAHRPTGFIDTPVPRLEFLIVPLVGIAQFALFVTLGILNRANKQSHKRYMVFATISLIGAGIARWPFQFIFAESPIPLFFGWRFASVSFSDSCFCLGFFIEAQTASGNDSLQSDIDPVCSSHAIDFENWPVACVCRLGCGTAGLICDDAWIV